MAKEKKGLGTGLDALFGGDAYEDEAGELLTLPISKVEPRSEQPREYFDEQALSELADSIAQYGVIQPIVARRLESGYYQIIAGERRWRAARMAGLALVENLLREDLNPIEEAKGYQSLINDYGLTQEEAARSVGRSRPAVTNSLRLLSLSPAVMELVEKKELSAGHARALIPITDSARQLDAAREVISKSLSVRRTEQLANRLLRQTSAKKGGEKDGLAVDYAAEISDELSRILGRRVHLNDGRKDRIGILRRRRSGKADRRAAPSQIE